MHKYKFIEIIDSFSDNEYKTLGKFLKSPYFNQSEKIVNLYEFLRKYYENYSLDEITIAKISKNFFKSDKRNYQKTRRLISDFTMLLEDFLIFQRIEKDVIRKKLYLIESMKRRKIEKIYISELRDLHNTLNIVNIKDKDYYSWRLQLINEEINAGESEGDMMGKYAEFNVVSEINYIYNKLYIYLLEIQKGVKRSEEISQENFITKEKLIEYLERKSGMLEAKYPGIYLHYLTLKSIITESDREIYTELEKFILGNRGNLDISEIEFCIYTLVNLIISKVRDCEYDNVTEKFADIRKIIQGRFLDNMESVSYGVFIYVILIALFEKDLSFAEAFFWRYLSKVKRYKEDAVNLVLSAIRFEQGRYGEAREHNEKVNFVNYEFYIIAKSVLLKIHYEENGLKFIYPIVDSFKHFLRRKKDISENERESYGLFLKYLMKLTSIKKKSRRDVLKMELELSKEKEFYSKRWIEEKMGELIREMTEEK